MRRIRRPFGVERLEERLAFDQSLGFSQIEGIKPTPFMLASFSFGSPNEFSANDFPTTIKWGDGTETKTFPQKVGPKSYKVIDSHIYHKEGPIAPGPIGEVFVDFPANDPVPARTLRASHFGVTVRSAGLTVTAKAFQVERCTNFSGVVATFKDLDPEGPESSSHYKATIFWGDGAKTLNAKVTRQGGSFTVSGEHTYKTAGNPTMKVTVLDDRHEDSEEVWPTSVFTNYGQSVLRQTVVDTTSIARNPQTGLLTIRGDKSTNNVSLRLAGTNLVVDMITIGCGGTTSRKQLSFNLNTIKDIVFNGLGGDDKFENQAKGVPSRAFGDAGKDTLIGNTGKDVFFGGDGDDTLDGGPGWDELHGGDNNNVLKGGIGNDKMFGDDGHDDLYGEIGDDEIHGGPGLDGLFGGGGVDKLFGEADADRFLVPQGSNEAKDLGSGDAQIPLLNGTATWTDAEVFKIDRGLGILHRLNGSVRLIKQPNGAPMPWKRMHLSADDPQKTQAENFQSGDGQPARIEVYDRAFRLHIDETALLAIHEMMHSWDLNNANRQVWINWKALSGWVSNNPHNPSKYVKAPEPDEDWWRLKDAESSFVTEFARDNPYEDWSYSIESYIAKVAKLKLPTRFDQPLTESSGKFKLLDGFIRGWR